MWIKITPPCEWRLFCFCSKIPYNLSNRYHSISKKVFVPSITSKRRSLGRRPAIPQECSHQALTEQLIYPSLVVALLTAQQCHFAVARQALAQCKRRSDPQSKHWHLVSPQVLIRQKASLAQEDPEWQTSSRENTQGIIVRGQACNDTVPFCLLLATVKKQDKRLYTGLSTYIHLKFLVISENHAKVRQSH